jgi:hypothetical protein
MPCCPTVLDDNIIGHLIADGIGWGEYGENEGNSGSGSGYDGCGIDSIHSPTWTICLPGI